MDNQIKALYPYEGQFLDVDGGRMHFLDEGMSLDTDQPVMLAVHGNPTWSFYWRRLVQEFGLFEENAVDFPDYRVVVPDHIGCGLSEKPQDWGYRLEQHIDNLCALVEHLELENIVLVVHDWGGAIGMGMAGRMPERIAKIVVTNTAAFRSQEIPLSIASCRIPIFGSIAVRGFNAFAGVATWRASAKGLSDDVKAGLVFPYNSWENRIATLKFVEDIPLKPTHPSYDALVAVEEGLNRLKDKPMLICWGEKDFCFTPNFRKEWEQRFPDADVHAWDDVGHYVIEDVPERLIQTMQEWLG